MKDLVSIIMPNYNCARFLPETVESVLAQTYENWELIIVDDCSTDESKSIILSYAAKDARVRPFFFEENRGAAAARNLALHEARGKWIAFLDSDDLWTSQKLEKQLAFMQKNGYVFSCTKYEQISEDSSPLNKVVVSPKKIGKRKMFRYCYVGCLTVMYDAEVMGVLQINEQIGNGLNDYALWLKAVRFAPCYYLNETLAKYRKRVHSLSHGGKSRLIKEHYLLMRISESRSKFVSLWYTGLHCFFGALKKTFCVKKVRKSKGN